MAKSVQEEKEDVPVAPIVFQLKSLDMIDDTDIQADDAEYDAKGILVTVRILFKDNKVVEMLAQVAIR